MNPSPMPTDHAPNPAHAAHDPLLVAALADGDAAGLTPDERRAGTDQVASCQDCATLLADLQAIAAAVPAIALPPRTRDFRLTPEDAQRLRPTGWRGFLAWVGSSHDTFTRPMAVGLTTLGIAGLLIGTVPQTFLSSGAGPNAASSASSEIVAGPSAAQPAPVAPDAAGAAAAAPAATAAIPAASAAGGVPVERAPSADASGESIFLGAPPAGSQPVATGVSPDQALGNVPQTQADRATNAGQSVASADTAIRDDTSGVSAILVVAGALTILGLGLFAIRWTARRLGDG
jgi:hypothetical protein